MEFTKKKVKTRVINSILITLAVVGVVTGLSFFLPQLARTAVDHSPILSAFYPYWHSQFPNANLHDFYTANGIDHHSNDINPATTQPYIQMTKYTTNIGTLAASIPTGTNKHNTVQKIMDWMHGNFNQPGNSNCTNIESLLRTADKILNDRCAVGCSDWDAAFIALARAKGISATHVNTVSGRWIEASKAAGCNHIPLVGHHVAEVYTGVSTNGGWELADPTTGVFTTYDSSGNALMRFDQSTPNRPLQAFGNGYKYLVFRRGIDAWDTGILNLQIQKPLIISQYGVPGNVCTHDDDLYSVNSSSNCNTGDTNLGSLKDPWSGSMKLCKKSSLNIYLKLGKNCTGSDTRAGILKGPNGILNWSLCYKDSKISINSVSDSSNCDPRYNQVGVFNGSDGSSKWKVCYRYTGQ